jgi:Ser/Thr protein kinase RdoA (MazF antagonist)
VQRIAEDLGLASQIYRVNLSGSELPPTVILKLWKTSTTAGTVEIEFYRQLSRDTPLRHPVAYAAGLDDAAEIAVLLLEDIQHDWHGDCLGQLDAPMAHELASMLARLHAAYWEAPVLAASWLPRLLAVTRPAQWHTERRALCRERFDQQLGPQLLRVVARSEEILERAAAVLAPAASTLVHGDLHLDNLLREAQTQRLVLLDWARCAAAPAVLDLVELLFSMTAASERAAVLATYWEGLSRSLSECQLAYEDLAREIAAALLRRGVVATLGTVMWEPGTARGEAIIAVNLERQEAALNWLYSELPDLAL